MKIRSLLPAILLVGAVAGTSATLVSAAGPAAPDGATIFRQRCASCHAVGGNRPATIAPNLAGVVGRRAASATFNYSQALRGSNLTWTRANLDRFLQRPAAMVPGTRMVIALPDAAQRQAVINYLATTRP